MLENLVIVDNPEIYPALNFTYDAKINALKNAGAKLLPFGDSPPKNCILMYGVFGNPWLAQQPQKFKGWAHSLLAKRRCWFLVEDMHYHTYKSTPLFIKQSMRHQLIFTYLECPERNTIFRRFPSRWIPHHIDQNVFYDQGQQRDIDVLFYGSSNRLTYPVRDQWLRTLEQNKELNLHVITHPGYKELAHQIHTNKLADLLNRAKYTVCCPSRFSYSVAKYFEIAACGSIPLGTSCKDIDTIGLQVAQSISNDNTGILVNNSRVVKHYSLDQYILRMKEVIAYDDWTAKNSGHD